MGEFVSKLFVDLKALPSLYDLPDVCLEPDFVPEDHLRVTFGGAAQLFFLAAVYSYLLVYASNLIANGSELLLLIPAIAPIVGSVVLPILGAVPDGAIILFSGLGDRSRAQESLSVGVGALAGSTIMLLTIPWLLSVYAGRVDIIDGECQYRRPPHESKETWKKLDGLHRVFTETGVQPDLSALRHGAKVMMVTSLPYFVIQGAAFAYHGESAADIAKKEQGYALFGLVVCFVCFIWYLWNQVKHANDDRLISNLVDEERAKALKVGMINLRGAFFTSLKDAKAQNNGENSVLLGAGAQSDSFRSVVRRFFVHYDKDGSGTIDESELKPLLTDLGMPCERHDIENFVRECDTDGSRDISFEEFLVHISNLVTGESSAGESNRNYGTNQTRTVAVAPSHTSHGASSHRAESPRTTSAVEGDEEEDEEEIPEDLAHLPPDVQQKRIIWRSLKMMGFGTAIVLIFSDPMVDVLSEIGVVIGVPAFYVSFILCPLASNASELLASYNYALRKTSKTITISLTSLEGAAIMNNTFGLGIFLSLVYFRELEWAFSAETISILFVELCVIAMAWRPIHTVRSASLIAILFPLSIAMVAILENVFGLD